MLTGHQSYRDLMAFEVTLIDESTELVDGADSYQLEGPLTTFYGGDRPRPLDSWSVKVASYRTDRIARIRRHGLVTAGRPHLELTGTDG
jgi:hypothetical protein